MHENAQKLSEKLREKFLAHTGGYSMVKICPSRRRFLRSFLTASKPSRRSFTAAKIKEKEKMERRKKEFQNIEKAKDVDDFCAIKERCK